MSSLRQLGRYRIEAYKGSRGETDAYKAFDMIRKRTVLLLTLKPEITANQQKLGRILHNAQAVSELVHPRLGWVWETGFEDGVTYVAERFVNGPSLRERLDESGPLSWEEASQVMEHVAQGLDFLHSKGRVHGALRPENITLSPEVGAVLGGLGIPETPLTLADLETPPKPANDDPNPSINKSEGKTQPAETTTPETHILPERYAAAPYSAPEVWMGDTPSAASDQYALACILVEMLSGKLLFAGANPIEICERSLEGPQLPASWPEGTPWQIEPALERALAQQPAERFASTGDFAAAPARMAARGVSSEDERRQREAIRQARLEAEARARRQAEEAERLAALERARREVEEQARLAAEAKMAAVAALAPAETAAAPVAETPALEGPRSPASRPVPDEAAQPEVARSRPGARRPRWLAWASIVLLLALAWLWGSGRLSGGGAAPTFTAIPSPAVTQPAAAQPSATTGITATSAPSATFTNTPAPSPTFTAQPTRTATRTPTATITPTATKRPPTATRTLRPSDGLDD